MDHILAVQRRIHKAMGRPLPPVAILKIYKRLLRAGDKDATFYRDLLQGDKEMEHYIEQARLDYENDEAEKERERWRSAC